MLTDVAGKKLCNFEPHVECIIKKEGSCKGESEFYVRVRLEFDDGHPKEAFIIPLEEVYKSYWWEKKVNCRLNPEITEPKFARYLTDAMKEEIDNAPKETIYRINHTGMSMIKGKAIFCTGLEVIMPPGSTISRSEVESLEEKRHLDIDDNLSEAEATAEMLDCISLSPDVGRVILAHKLIYLMYQAYVEAGKRPNVCVFLIGETGTNKTTFSAFLTQMYNRGSGIASPLRLNASIAAAVKSLSESYDDTIVLDDLFPARSKSIRRQQEETFLEVARYIADGTIPARMKGNKLSKGLPRCGVVFTGEYIVGSGSDAARMLPVEMTRPNAERLKYFQDRPLTISTFYYFYVKWLVENYDEIVPVLKAWVCEYQKLDLGIHRRLQETHFFFNTAYALLLQYCCEKHFLSKKDAIQLQISFCDLLTTLVRQHDEKVSRKDSKKVESKSYWESIRELYKSGQLSIARGVESFDKERDDGVIHNKSLYLRGDKLSVYFPQADISDIVDEMDSKHVLEAGQKSRTKQISALRGMRFYVIPLVHLS